MLPPNIDFMDLSSYGVTVGLVSNEIERGMEAAIFPLDGGFHGPIVTLGLLEVDLMPKGIARAPFTGLM